MESINIRYKKVEKLMREWQYQKSFIRINEVAKQKEVDKGDQRDKEFIENLTHAIDNVKRSIIRTELLLNKSLPEIKED